MVMATSNEALQSSGRTSWLYRMIVAVRANLKPGMA